VFRNHARKIVFALSLFAAVGSMLPGAIAAAAAPIRASDPVATLQYDFEVAQPKPVYALSKMSVRPLLVTRNGRNTDYVFRIQADGGTLPDVSVLKGSGYSFSHNDEFVHWTNGVTEQKGTFSAPSYRDVHVSCNPPVGKYCSAGWIHVTTSNGLFVAGANGEDGNK
jgi:hypothetical protein